jgi:hypothetical protein
MRCDVMVKAGHVAGMITMLWMPLMTHAVRAARVPSRMSSGSAVIELDAGGQQSTSKCLKTPLLLKGDTSGKTVLVCDAELSQLRDAFGAPSPLEIMEKAGVDLTKDAKSSGGKSGSKMIITPDKKYILKTMTKRDYNAFKRSVKNYVKYMREQMKSTLCVRIFAVIKDAQGKKWIIMNNWAPLKFPKLYDFKANYRKNDDAYSEVILKGDEWRKTKMQLQVPPEVRDSVLKALPKDSAMLSKEKLIDYSTIVGQVLFDAQPCGGIFQHGCLAPICTSDNVCVDASYPAPPSGAGATIQNWNAMRDLYCEGEPGESSAKKREFKQQHDCVGYMRTDKPAVGLSCFGIIDIFKYWDFSSKSEYLFTGGWARNISVQAPKNYKERFDKFMSTTMNKADTRLVHFEIQDSTCRYWGARDKAWIIWPMSGLGTAVASAVLLLVIILGVGLACLMLRMRPKEGYEGMDEPDYPYSQYSQEQPQSFYSDDASQVSYQNNQGMQQYPQLNALPMPTSQEEEHHTASKGYITKERNLRKNASIAQGRPWSWGDA